MALKQATQSSRDWSIPVVRNYNDIDAYKNLENKNIVVDCGWGRLLFGQTFDSPQNLVDTLIREEEDRRDIAFYLQDPHVILSKAPQKLFLDPSHTYRLFLNNFDDDRRETPGYRIRRLQEESDARAVRRILKSNHMLPAETSFMDEHRKSKLLTYLVAEDTGSGEILGTVLGIDHVEAFPDPENSSSLWCLAVDPQAPFPGIGRALVNHLAIHFKDLGRHYMDLSVLVDNRQAIRLYEDMGFKRIPIFCVKRKNPINEKLFTEPVTEKQLNPYATIIIDEATRRGVEVDVLDADEGYFTLSLGGRTITCRESLSELTTAIAMSRCANKQLATRILRREGISTPAQVKAGDDDTNLEFLASCGKVVVKPRDAEQGQGITVGVDNAEDLHTAIDKAYRHDDVVLLEEFIHGDDVRVVVIDHKVVAVAVRRPASITGNGRDDVRTLIEKQSRRRRAATEGESSIPFDDITGKCVQSQGYGLDDVLPVGLLINVRDTANLHTGGTIHDITNQFSPRLKEISEEISRILDIPVVGLDLIVPDQQGTDYWFIEANERPGLANHEPQPTAQRFIDLLFPTTRTR